MEDSFFWFIIRTVGPMIPCVGTLIGIIPVFILTIASENEFKAWEYLYMLVVVGSICNLIGFSYFEN